MMGIHGRGMHRPVFASYWMLQVASHSNRRYVAAVSVSAVHVIGARFWTCRLHVRESADVRPEAAMRSRAGLPVLDYGS